MSRPTPTLAQEKAAEIIIRGNSGDYGPTVRQVITSVATLIAERDAARAERDRLQSIMVVWRARFSQISGCSDARTAREIASGILAAPPIPAPAKEPA